MLNFTDQGIKNIKQGPDKLDAAIKVFKDAGAEIKDFYLLIGQYDAIVISEAPDDETTAKVALMVGAMGNVKTTMFRSFSESDYKKIVTAMT